MVILGFIMSVRLLFSRRVRGRIIRDLDRLYNVVSNIDLLYKVCETREPTVVNVGGVQVQSYYKDTVSAFITGKFISERDGKIDYYKYSIGVRVDFRELRRVEVEDKRKALEIFLEDAFKIAKSLLKGKTLHETLSSEIGEVLEYEEEEKLEEVKAKCKSRRLGVEEYIEIEVGEGYFEINMNRFLIVFHLSICRKMLDRERIWVMEEPEKLRFTWNPKIRVDVMRHVNNICRLASKPEILEKIHKLPYDEYAAHYISEFNVPPDDPKYYFKIGNYYFCRASTTSTFPFYVFYDEEYDRLHYDKSWILKLRLVFRPKSNIEYYLSKVGNILSSIAKFANYLLRGKTFGKIGRVVEYCGKYGGRHFIVWGIVDGNIIMAEVDEKDFKAVGSCFWISYPTLQAEPKYRRDRKLLLKDFEKLLNIARDPTELYTEITMGDIRLEIDISERWWY